MLYLGIIIVVALLVIGYQYWSYNKVNTECENDLDDLDTKINNYEIKLGECAVDLEQTNEELSNTILTLEETIKEKRITRGRFSK